MSVSFKTKPLGELIVENPKSKLKVMDSLDEGSFVFFTSGKKIKAFNDYLCDGENIFIATGGVANISYHSGRAAYSTDCYSITAKDGLLTKYLYYFLVSNLKLINDSMFMGAALKHLQKKMFKNILVPIPSLVCQKRILVLLDELFAGIDAAIANTEKNIVNARELFESYLNSVFAQHGEEWKEKTLKQVCIDFGRGKSKHRPRNDPKLYGGPYPFIQTGDVRNCEHLIKTSSQSYNAVGLAQSKLWPKGTICITIAANIAETGIIDFDACFPDSIIGMVVDENQTSNAYVEYLLQSVKARIKAKGKGSAQDNINLATFENEFFPFPDLNKQSEIVSNLHDLSASIQRLELIYQQKNSALDELKQSLLQKALSGELTAEDGNLKEEAVA